MNAPADWLAQRRKGAKEDGLLCAFAPLRDTRGAPVRQRRNPCQPGATPQESRHGRSRAESPAHPPRRAANGSGFQPSLIQRRIPGALPQAGMDAGLWPSRFHASPGASPAEMRAGGSAEISRWRKPPDHVPHAHPPRQGRRTHRDSSAPPGRIPFGARSGGSRHRLISVSPPGCAIRLAAL